MSDEDRTGQLKKALLQLEKLTQVLSTTPINEIFKAQINERKADSSSPFALVNKILKSASSFFDSLFHEDSSRITKEYIFQTIQQISTLLPWVEDMKNGSSDQKELAERTIGIIENYNRLIDSKIAPQPFIQKIPPLQDKKIGVPKKTSPSSQWYIKTSIDKPLDGTVRSVFAGNLPSGDCGLSLREQDAFRMKAISLMLKEQIAVKSAIHAVKQAPIEKKWDPTQNMFVAVQTVSTLPGERRTFVGIFDNKHALVNLHCTLLIEQTGFPASCQYSGGLILSAELADKKFEAMRLKLASDLLPEGSKNCFAKQLVDLKREVFNQNKDLFIEAHTAHVLHFFDKVSDNQLKPEERLVINKFFEKINSFKQPFDVISEAFQLIARHVIHDRMTVEEIASIASSKIPEISNLLLLSASYLHPSIQRFCSNQTPTEIDRFLANLANSQLQNFYEEMQSPSLPAREEMTNRMLVYTSI